MILFCGQIIYILPWQLCEMVIAGNTRKKTTTWLRRNEEEKVYKNILKHTI